MALPATANVRGRGSSFVFWVDQALRGYSSSQFGHKHLPNEAKTAPGLARDAQSGGLPALRPPTRSRVIYIIYIT
jgi:hypothetical protein